MAVTKILARHARLDLAINYAVNSDKTDEEVLTAYLNCDRKYIPWSISVVIPMWYLLRILR